MRIRIDGLSWTVSALTVLILVIGSRGQVKGTKLVLEGWEEEQWYLAETETPQRLNFGFVVSSYGPKFVHSLDGFFVASPIPSATPEEADWSLISAELWKLYDHRRPCFRGFPWSGLG